MPFLGLENKIPINKRETKDKDHAELYQENRRFWRNFLTQNKEVHLGTGSSTVVIKDNSSENLVLAFSMTQLSPYKAKDIYYSAKILNILFPYNFPKIHAAFANNETQDATLGGTIRERAFGDTLEEGGFSTQHMFNPEVLLQKNHDHLLSFTLRAKHYLGLIKTPEIIHPFKKVLEERVKLRRLGIVLPFDIKPDNFIITDEGNEQYVDISEIGNYNSFANIDYVALHDYMVNNDYSDNDFKKVMNSLKRIEALKQDRRVTTS